MLAKRDANSRKSIGSEPVREISRASGVFSCGFEAAGNLIAVCDGED